MSQYLNIFVRTDNHEYIELWSYSRNTRMYSFFKEYVPFEKVVLFTKEMFHNIRADIQHDISEYQKQGEKYKIVLNSPGVSVEEKFNIMDDIVDIEEAITDIKRCEAALCLISDMEMPVFMGIEACDITDEDVKNV